MANNFTKKCPNCGTIVGFIERPMGVPGGKDRENADCPICGKVFYSGMTDGWFDTSIVSINDTIEPNKSEYLLSVNL